MSPTLRRQDRRWTARLASALTALSLCALGAPAGAVGAAERPSLASLEGALTPGLIEGVVRDGAGRPVGGAEVWIASPTLPGGLLLQIADAEGRFAFRDLAPSVYTLGARWEGGGRAEGRVLIGRYTPPLTGLDLTPRSEVESADEPTPDAPGPSA